MKIKQLMAMAVGATLMTSVAFGQSTLNTFTFTNGFANGGVVPDGDPNGLALLTNLSGQFGAFSTITNVTVNLNISGGYNGDLYAYLAGPTGGFAILLNRVGVSNSASQFGYGDTGFNVTFLDAAAQSIQYYQSHSPSYNGNGQLTGNWQPDGVNIDPQSDPSLFWGASQTAMLDSFNGTDADGTWTLFLADLSGGGQGTLISWGLQIETVPEPSSGKLLAMAGIFGAAILFLRRRARING